MSYIGTKPTIGNFQICDAISVVNGQAAYTMQVGSVNVIPQSANHMIVSLNGTIQKPNSSFTVSGSTITFSSNLATGDVIDFIQILGDVLDLGVPSDATVTTAKLGANSVTSAKLNNDIISGTTELASEPADTDEFLVSDAGTLKRIDYSLIKGTSGLSFISNNTIGAGGGEIQINDQFTSSYVNYKVIVSGMNMATDNVQLRMRMIKDADDSQENASSYNYSIVGQRGAGNAVDDGGVNAQEYVIISNNANTGQSINFDMTIYKPFVSGHYTSFTHIAGGRRSGGDGHMTSGGGYLNQTTQYSGIKLYFSSGTLSAGNVLIFGIADS